ncbi:MAG: DASH complex subunit dam1 [Pycnora praestabilis]|nr:MAG: DASH complex subunit dam1 [Pycnora praestabilis]
MASSATPNDASNKGSTSRNRTPSSRPTTPLRPTSRSSLREGQGSASRSNARCYSSSFPLETFEPAFAEFSDSMADLEANFTHLQLMHESLTRFNESFASFLYGLNMNAFCVDFPEAPILDSFERTQPDFEQLGCSDGSDKLRPEFDSETTFMTTDTSFVDNPPMSSKTLQNLVAPAPLSKAASLAKRGSSTGRPSVKGAGRGIRGSGLARAKGR